MTTSYPLITLTTDFGHDEPFVGMMKGVILSRYPAARIVDLTHEIPLFTPSIAGFWVQRSLPYFPTGTIHVAIRRDAVFMERTAMFSDKIEKIRNLSRNFENTRVYDSAIPSYRASWAFALGI